MHVKQLALQFTTHLYEVVMLLCEMYEVIASSDKTSKLDVNIGSERSVLLCVVVLMHCWG